jgi:hypothetical protein
LLLVTYGIVSPRIVGRNYERLESVEGCDRGGNILTSP